MILSIVCLYHLALTIEQNERKAQPLNGKNHILAYQFEGGQRLGKLDFWTAINHNLKTRIMRAPRRFIMHNAKLRP